MGKSEGGEAKPVFNLASSAVELTERDAALQNRAVDEARSQSDPLLGSAISGLEL